MEKQELNRDFHTKLNDEFLKIDNFLKEFRLEFVFELSTLIKELNPGILIDETLKEGLLQYSNQISAGAESVYDKDMNYNEFRLKNELDDMTRVIEKGSVKFHDSYFAQQTHRKAKAVVVKFFPELAELSANGFRLLEKYCLLYNREFVLSLKSEMKTLII